LDPSVIVSPIIFLKMKISYLVFSCFLLLSACAGSADRDKVNADSTQSGIDDEMEAKAVVESFASYKSAILNDKGEVAVKYVDSRTISYYSKVLDLVKNADSSKVESLGLLDKLMVLIIRHKAPKEEILSFDGKGLLVYSINNGMIGKNGAANNSIGEVTVVDDFAKGQLVVSDKPTPLAFHFYKEDDQWKVDLTSAFPASEAAFQQMVDQSGQAENEYLLSLLEMTSGKKAGSEIWQPVR
jgi:hypothetical protein